MPINRIKYKFQFNEDDETWDDECKEFGIQIDDNTTEISSSESSIETNGDISEEISEETRENCKVSEHGKELFLIFLQSEKEGEEKKDYTQESEFHPQAVTVQ